MRKELFVLIFVLFASTSFAQKFAYVDVDYILERIPDYASAQTQLDQYSEKWQGDIENMESTLQNMRNVYANEEVLYSEEVKKEKWTAILDKEQALYKFKQEKFGYNGELFQKRQELIKPIQDNIYSAIEDLAKAKRYDFIFDKSSTPIMLFAKEDYDKSNDIIKALGYKP